MTLRIRSEIEADAADIHAVTARAFDGQPHSDGSEPAIVDRLREVAALTVSLVATDRDDIIGHVAFSPVDWPGKGRWAGLGPVSVMPEHQGRGVGSKLIREGLDRIRALGFDGCVVLGDPAYYGRFGFESAPGFSYPGPPPEYFMRLAFGDISGHGDVRYHAAFG